MPDPVWKGLSEVIRDKLSMETLLNRPSKLKTGFDGLDRVLGGGLAPGLIVLGGVSNVGKSTFALQMAECLAEQVPVLYYTLEMTGEYVGAKMISRRLFRTAWEEEGAGGFSLERWERIGEKCASADRIISSAGEFSPDLWQRIAEARQYVEERARKLYVMEKALTAKQIAEEVERFIEDHPGEKQPVVIVDYLQILPSEGPGIRNERQVVDGSIRALVGMARQGITVFLISALSRGTHEVRMDSFKESGNIEYSADILLGLQFQACHRPLKKGERFDDLEEKKKIPREVEITVLKQRYGDCGRQIPLRYYSEYDCFEEAEKTEKAHQDLGTEVLIPEEAAQTPPEADTPSQEAVPSDFMDIASHDSYNVLNDAPASDLAPDPRPEEATVPQESKPDGPEKRSSIPTSVMCNTKIANEIRQGAFGLGNRCEVMRGIYTEFDLLPGALTYADCDVADAIYTLYKKYDRSSFSAGQVLRALSGDERQTLTVQKKREIIQSIEHLRNTSIVIRCEEEMKEREKKKEQPQVGPSSFQGAFLNVREKDGRYFFEFEKGGNPMPLYAYGEVTRQMISFPRALLCVRDDGRKLRDSAETVFAKRYLIRRLEILRNKQKNKSSGFQSISLREDRELAAQLRLNENFPSRALRMQKRRRLQAPVLEILAYFKEIQYIQDYDYQKAAQRVEIVGQVQDPWSLPALGPISGEKQ